MPRPWRWNSFGLYHALFMAVNLTLAFLFIEQVISSWSLVTTNSLLVTGLLFVLAGWFLMLLFFFLDRRVMQVFRA